MSKAKKTYRTLSEKEILNYLQGKLKGKDAHKLERHLLNDAFDREATEGFEQFSNQEVQSDIQLLKSKVSKKEVTGLNPWLRRAAAVALLMVSLAVVWLTIDNIKREKDSGITMNEPVDLSRDPGPDLLPETRSSGIPAIPTPPPEPETPQKAVPRQKPLKETEKIAEDLDEMALEEPVKKGILFEEQTPALANEGIKLKPAQPRAVSPEKKAAERQFRSAERKAHDQASRAVASSRSAGAEAVHVHGQVTNESGEPLPGVSVFVKGTGKGTVTDLDGKFKMDGLSEGAALIFSFVGYEPIEAEIHRHREINIELRPNVSSLNEVVTRADDRNEPVVLGYESAYPIVQSGDYDDYLKENLNYPEEALSERIEGKVVIKLTISSSGEISGVEVKRSLGYGCDQEAIRLIQEGPDWQPAIRDGQPVKSTVRVNVKFELD